MMYYVCKVHADTLSCGTDKAFSFRWDDGRMGRAKNRRVWIPRSICVIEEKNDLGWCKLLIPRWFIDKNQVDWRRLADLTFGNPDDGLFVDR